MYSVLLIGPPGCGKSTAASTAEPPILYLDMDHKIEKMISLQPRIGKDIFVWVPDEKLFTGKLANFVQGATNPQAKYTQQRAMGYIKLAQKIDELENNGCMHEGKQMKTVVLDTWTSTEEHQKRLLMSANGVATISQPLWGTILTNNENMISSLLNLKGVNLIVCAHEQAIKDELTGMITYAPLIGGQFKDKIGKDFEEVYFMEKKVSGDKASYEMLTLGNAMKACRTTRELPSRVQPDFGVIYGKKA